MAPFIDLTGRRFGSLTALRRHSTSRAKKAIWLCRCDCGRKVTVVSGNLTSGDTKSCGCQRFPSGKAHPGWSGYGEIPGHYWWNVTRRLRGSGTRKIPVTITIEYAWELFLQQERRCALTGLLLTMKKSQSDRSATASLDRIDSGKGYEPGNVQWVHKDINRMKNTYSQGYFIEMCRQVARTADIVKMTERRRFRRLAR